MTATADASIVPDANDPKALRRPVWVVRAPPTIVDGHSGLLYARYKREAPHAYLIDRLITMHTDLPAAASKPFICGR
jgi:hypothetical protein